MPVPQLDEQTVEASLRGLTTQAHARQRTQESVPNQSRLGEDRNSDRKGERFRERFFDARDTVGMCRLSVGLRAHRHVRLADGKSDPVETDHPR